MLKIGDQLEYRGCSQDVSGCTGAPAHAQEASGGSVRPLSGLTVGRLLGFVGPSQWSLAILINSLLVLWPQKQEAWACFNIFIQFCVF